MSKQDRAAKAIKFGAARGYTPEQTATLLNELNLLTPELPEPDTVNAGGLKTWGPTKAMVVQSGEVVQLNCDGVATVAGVERARSLANSLLAAAQLAEEEHLQKLIDE